MIYVKSMNGSEDCITHRANPGKGRKDAPCTTCSFAALVHLKLIPNKNLVFKSELERPPAEAENAPPSEHQPATQGDQAAAAPAWAQDRNHSDLLQYPLCSRSFPRSEHSRN